MEKYTVSLVARISGVTVRTLQHYDKIGLLKPAERARSGYRYYGKDELYRLQQILFFKELGFSLKRSFTFWMSLISISGKHLSFKKMNYRNVKRDLMSY